MAREATKRLLEMIEDGVIDRQVVITACVNYMSEDDVADMCRSNYFFEHDEDEDNSEDDYGNQWPSDYETCETCGQPDNCGDCDHTPLSADEVRELGGVPHEELV